MGAQVCFVFVFGDDLSVLLTIFMFLPLTGKTGKGSDAVLLATRERWHELAEYCMQDTIKTFQMSQKARVARGGLRLPRRGVEIGVGLLHGGFVCVV